ncbi:hypothetical protein [Methylocystis bryophila]|uniref:Lipoprotein n=1 Tax=Methylocystis bryophila TaxID=655015 RepID=A0A1W6N274_9HYPH|nr:hypothetical protein [Methylocystis bryophila]ARN83866.1 hypothetical protein B1812_21125 [Methylocystis bryophila]BDV39496.1 hypothetical protein DSM21852_27490 [Methylocystis bryophila]
MFRWKSADKSAASAALLCSLLLLSACVTSGPEAPPAPVVVSAPASISPDALVGSWGLAAYHRDSDRPRTESEAKRQCNNPYVIKRGPNGGVIMHLADVPEPQELVLKGGPGGANFVGLPGAPGAPEDREVFAVSARSFSVRWVNPDNANRYGVMIYVRCA